MVNRCIFPFFFVMTGFATLAQFILVHIIFFVTRNTILRKLLLIETARMAGNTFNLFVFVF